ncbi:MAG TPA: dTDP-4-dehydrorhamnose reductase [Candidatus Acidoferrum sp.]|jgi:dTDP-4-dehydrorhamnose reductase
MKPRILLIGSSGQVGHELAGILPRAGEVVVPDRAAFDLTRSSDVARIIHDTHPQIIVNAAAYTAVDLAEKEPEKARAINAEAPAAMAAAATELNALLVHYSTDYVFDGSKDSPYAEDDPTNPLNVYGQTKLDGENAIRDSGCRHLILRTAWVYATRGKNFLLTILRLASQREELRIVSDQIGAPTWAHEIARATSSMVERHAAAAAGDTPPTGTFHVTAGGTTNWHAFASAIVQEAAKLPGANPWLNAALGGRTIVTKRITPISTADYPTPAHRPAYSVLSNERLTQSYHLQLPEWRDQLKAALASV